MTKFNDELNLDMDKVMANSISHDDLMQEHLKDKDYQRIYLETSLEEFAKDGNIDAFIRSLQHVVKARGRGAISALAKEHVKKTEDVVKLGDEILVKCLGYDKKGRLNFSRKDALN